MIKDINFKETILRSKKVKPLLLITIFICLLIFLLIFFISSSNGLTSESYTILQKGENINSINVKGEIESNDTTDVYSTSNTTIKEVNVKVGDKVKAGDTLATLDTADLESSIKQLETTIKTTKEINKEKMDKAKQVYDNAVALSEEGSNSEIINAESGLKAAELDLENKQKILDYNEDLFKYGDISEQELKTYRDNFENSKNAYNTAYTTLNNLKDKVALTLSSSKAEYEIAKKNYEDTSQEVSLDRKKQQLIGCTILAPEDGIVTSVNAVGGNPSTGNLFKIANLNSIITTVKVKEVDIAKIKIGQEAQIQTDSTGNESLKGEVFAISQTAKKSEDPLTLKDDSNDEDAEYEVKVKINDSTSNLKIGMKTRVDIIIDKKDDVYTVPCESIFKNTDDKDCIYIAKPQGNKYVVKEIPVTLGSQSDLYVEIISDSIKDGDIVLTSPLSYKEGSKIKINLSK